MSNALFAPSSRALSRNMVEIKAGRMKLENTIMSADTRKGLIYIYQSDDSLIHFCWRDRTTGNVEEDLIIFPDDCEFKRIPECKTGRVYVLKFKSSTRRLYFWMQDLKTDKDDENCRLVNDTLNHPPTSGRSSSGGGEGELHSLLNNMSQQQLIQLFGNVGAGNIGSLTSLLSGTRSPSSRSSKSPKTSSSSSSSSSTPKESKSETPVTTSELENWFKKYSVPETKPDGSRQPLNLTGKVNANILTALFKNPSSLSELYNLIWNPNLPNKDKLISSTYIRVLTMLHKCSETGELQLEKLKNINVTPELVSAANERELMTFMSLIYTNPAYGGAGDATPASGTETKDEKQEGEPEDKKGKE